MKQTFAVKKCWVLYSIARFVWLIYMVGLITKTCKLLMCNIFGNKQWDFSWTRTCCMESNKNFLFKNVFSSWQKVFCEDSVKHMPGNSTVRSGDSVDNTIEENSSVFSLIRMRWFPSARACGSKTLHQQNPLVLNWRCWWLTQVDLYNGHKTVGYAKKLLYSRGMCSYPRL